MESLLGWLGNRLASYLTKTIETNGTGVPTSPDRLRACLQPGDVLLIEGNTRVSTAIKYLTQSTWSHAALFVGNHLPQADGNAGHCFIEVDMVVGVRSVGLEEYAHLHTRICRPVLSQADCQKVTAFAIARLGNQYDLRNIVDLARYLLPTPPVPVRFRRRMIALGSGDPTRAICSTLIAQAFQSIRYPILPNIVNTRKARRADGPDYIEEILRVRHHSLFAPRDFDVSPYFQIIKPTLAENFDYTALRWHDRP